MSKSIQEPASRQTKLNGQEPFSIRSHEAGFTRPDWADFQMEHAYWQVLEEICNNTGVTKEEFAIVAMIHYPDLPKASAVQSEMLSCLCNQRGVDFPHLAPTANRTCAVMDSESWSNQKRHRNQRLA